MRENQFWLIKSEPTTYGIDHLKTDKKTAWTGVRNFQARNYMRDDMRIGDQILFYHSNCKEPGVYGVAKVASAPYPDPTQFDKNSDYYDPKAIKEKPTWYLVDVAFVKKLKTPILLEAIRSDKILQDMVILRPGNRLSITPVSPAHFAYLTKSP